VAGAVVACSGKRQAAVCDLGIGVLVFTGLNFLGFTAAKADALSLPEGSTGADSVVRCLAALISISSSFFSSSCG